LKNLKGERVSLEEFKGRVVLVHFWATWCLPCRQELPTLQRLWEEMGERGLVVLAIAIDRRDADKIQGFKEEHGLTFPILLDPKGIARKAYLVRGIPTTYIIGRDGRFSGLAIGARDWTSQQLRAFLQRLLGERGLSNRGDGLQ